MNSKLLVANFVHLWWWTMIVYYTTYIFALWAITISIVLKHSHTSKTQINCVGFIFHQFKYTWNK